MSTLKMVMAVVPVLDNVTVLMENQPRGICPKSMLAGEIARLEVELTVWLTEAEALVLKFVSPLYVATSVRLPAVAKVIEQLPDPELIAALQDSPVLAVTVTLPVGVVTPVTLKAMATDWKAFEGLGAFEVIVVVLAAFAAVTVFEACAGE